MPGVLYVKHHRSNLPPDVHAHIAVIRGGMQTGFVRKPHMFPGGMVRYHVPDAEHANIAAKELRRAGYKAIGFDTVKEGRAEAALATLALIEHIDDVVERGNEPHKSVFKPGWSATKRPLPSLGAEHGFEAKAHAKGGHAALVPKHVYHAIKHRLGVHAASDFGDHVRVRTAGPNMAESWVMVPHSMMSREGVQKRVDSMARGAPHRAGKLHAKSFKKANAGEAHHGVEFTCPKHAHMFASTLSSEGHEAHKVIENLGADDVEMALTEAIAFGKGHWRQEGGKFGSTKMKGGSHWHPNVPKVFRERVQKMGGKVKSAGGGGGLAIVFEDMAKCEAAFVALCAEGIRVVKHDLPGVLFVNQLISESATAAKEINWSNKMTAHEPAGLTPNQTETGFYGRTSHPVHVPVHDFLRMNEPRKLDDRPSGNWLRGHAASGGAIAPPMLYVEPHPDHPGEHRVTGHEGRGRAMLAGELGHTTVPVQIRFRGEEGRNKYNTKGRTLKIHPDEHGSGGPMTVHIPAHPEAGMEERVDPKELAMGVEDEREHTSPAQLKAMAKKGPKAAAKQIALTHLQKSDPHYYSKMKDAGLLDEDFTQVHDDEEDAEDVAQSRSDDVGGAFAVLALDDGTFLVVPFNDAVEHPEANLHAVYQDGKVILDPDDADDADDDDDIDERFSFRATAIGKLSRRRLKLGHLSRAKNARQSFRARLRRGAVYAARKKARIALHRPTHLLNRMNRYAHR